MRGITAPLVKLIIFAVVTIFLTGVLATTIGSFGFGNAASYRAMFTDVTGLQPGDDVRIAGVKVGSVQDVSIAQRNYAQVTFSVLKSEPVTSTTIVTIRYRNLVGQRYVELSEGPGTGTRLLPDALIPLAQTRPALDLTVLFNGFRPLFQALNPQDVNRLSDAIVKTLQGEGGTINTLLAQTASLTNTLADRDKLIGEVITNLNTVLGTVNQRDAELSNLILQLQRFVSGLAADRQAIGDSLTNIASVESATADLVQRGRPAIRGDIAGLYAVSKTLNDSQSVVDGVLQRLPGKLQTLINTGNSGSWFKFYLCNASGTIVGPGNQPIKLDVPANTDPKCAG